MKCKYSKKCEEGKGCKRAKMDFKTRPSCYKMKTEAEAVEPVEEVIETDDKETK